MILFAHLKHYQRLLSSLSVLGAKNSKLLLFSGQREPVGNYRHYPKYPMFSSPAPNAVKIIRSRNIKEYTSSSRTVRVYQGSQIAKKMIRLQTWAVTEPKSMNSKSMKSLLSSNPNLLLKTL